MYKYIIPMDSYYDSGLKEYLLFIYYISKIIVK